MKNLVRFLDDNKVSIMVKYKGDTMETLISQSDLDKANSIKGTWKVIMQKGVPYIGFNHKVNNKWQTLRLHRFLTNATQGQEVDHLNGNTLDNTRNNLLVTDHRGNMQNKRDYKNNTSGVRGVSWHKPTGKWQLKYKGKYAGIYNTLEEAEEAIRKITK